MLFRLNLLLLLLLFFGLLGIQVSNAQDAKPRPRTLTLEEKAKLPYVFVGEFESLGAESALQFEPGLKLAGLGDGAWWVVVRVVQPLAFPPKRLLSRRVLIRMYPNWFYRWDRGQHLDAPLMGKLFQERYQGKQFIFFGWRLGNFDGVSDQESLRRLTNRDSANHEALDKLSEVKMLIEKN